MFSWFLQKLWVGCGVDVVVEIARHAGGRDVLTEEAEGKFLITPAMMAAQFNLSGAA